jgi:hypothetical protein
MRVTFNRTIDDLVNFNRFHWHHSPAAQRMYRWNFLSVPLAGVIAAFIMREEPTVVVALIAMGAMIGSCLGLVWATRWSLKWAVQRMATEGHSKGAFGQHDIEIGPDGVYERTAVNESRQSWSSIERVTENDRYIVIYIQPMAAHVIPMAAFASPTEAASFFSQAQSFHLGTPESRLESAL